MLPTELSILRDFFQGVLRLLPGRPETFTRELQDFKSNFFYRGALRLLPGRNETQDLHRRVLRLLPESLATSSGEPWGLYQVVLRLQVQLLLPGRPETSTGELRGALQLLLGCPASSNRGTVLWGYIDLIGPLNLNGTVEPNIVLKIDRSNFLMISNSPKLLPLSNLNYVIFFFVVFLNVLLFST